MTAPCSLKPKLILLAILTAYAMPQMAIAENRAEALELSKIEVVGTTPLPSIGLPLDQVPANIQAATGQSINEQRSLNLSEFMDSNLGSVTVNDTVSNPYQPDVIFRGFTASPLLGTPQGLSVFVDGVRVNESFGDVVNWDLIPSNAISNINLIPGSNPLFGLNTLGGALSVHTKSGTENPGTSATLSGGSWGRRAFEFETGGVVKDKNIDYFVAGNFFNEDGWRDYSKSEVKQIFGKVGWQDDKSNLDLSLSLADNKINGIQGLPLEQLYNRSQAYSVPDHINNQMEMIALNGSHFISDDQLLAGNIYFRHVVANGFNSNVNNNYNIIVPSTYVNYDPVIASNVVTKTDTDGFGGALQMTFLKDLIGHKNQFTGGVSADFGRTNFTSDTQNASIVGITTISNQPLEALSTVRLKANNDYYGLYGTDTFSLTDKLHLTMSGRYNVAIVDLRGSSLAAGDITLAAGDLDGHHVYQRFNPAVGLNFNPAKSINFFGGYNEGMRAPSPVELSCADPTHPCALPNAFGGDPNLQEVVSKTWEGGARGRINENFNWSAGLFRTENSNDIQFIASNTSGSGYFQNVGKTLRQGVELGMNGKVDKFSFQANYSFVDATFQTPFTEFSAANSSSDSSNNGSISVNKGNRISGVPQHTLKVRLGYEITPAWTVGSNVITTSSRYARGDENNQDSHGQIPGYTTVNLDTHYSINENWKFFAKVQNLFDRNYATFGQLGVNEFGRGGVWNSGPVGWNNNTQFQTPGAPRAAWVGVTYEFDKPKTGSPKVDLD